MHEPKPMQVLVDYSALVNEMESDPALRLIVPLGETTENLVWLFLTSYEDDTVYNVIDDMLEDAGIEPSIYRETCGHATDAFRIYQRVEHYLDTARKLTDEACRSQHIVVEDLNFVKPGVAICLTL